MAGEIRNEECIPASEADAVAGTVFGKRDEKAGIPAPVDLGDGPVLGEINGIDVSFTINRRSLAILGKFALGGKVFCILGKGRSEYRQEKDR